MEENNVKKGKSKKKLERTLLTGFQPTGVITLGNYLGTVQNCLKYQDGFNSIFFIADLHSLTVRRDPKELNKASISFYAQLLACGITPKLQDAKKTLLFFQSHVPQVSELQWILNCYTAIGELERMTQFKDKSAKHEDNINVGLLDYPVLMASDILAYQTDLVPVGVDQKQHLELTRDLAIRVNHLYGDLFKVPEPIIAKAGAKIYSLQDPTSKMSKSDPNPNATISIIDSEQDIVKKFKRAVTDSGSELVLREDKPGISNLITIYSCITGKTVEDVEKEFAGSGYGNFKVQVGEAVAAKFKPIREEVERLLTDETYLETLAKESAKVARRIAKKTLDNVQKKVGLVKF